MAKVKVPQADGEILVSVAGDPPRLYKVAAGHTEVEDEELEFFLAHVEGSQMAGSPSRKEE